MYKKFEDSEGFKTFKSEFPQSLYNIENDNTLNETQKESFFEYLSHFSASKEIHDYCNNFFWNSNNQLLGQIVSLEANENLGRIQTMQSLRKRLFDTRKIKKRKYLSNLINDILGSDTNLRLTKIKLYFGDENISTVHMWSFRGKKDRIKPFLGEELEKLPCLLGLSEIKKYYIGFTHKLPITSNPQKPTFFDAGLFIHWRPGGNTKPIESCNKENNSGFEELIHKSSQFNDIVEDIYDFEG
jgi:hypothetical protein